MPLSSSRTPFSTSGHRLSLCRLYSHFHSILGQRRNRRLAHGISYHELDHPGFSGSFHCHLCRGESIVSSYRSRFLPSQISIMVNLLRIMLTAQVFFSISGFLTGIIQSHQRFLIPALAPVAYNLGIIGA